jgi:hypothetical protein
VKASLLSEELLPPGGEGKVEIQAATAGRAGEFSKAATVETDDPAYERTVLTVKANVVVDLDFDRPHLRFPTIMIGEESVQVVPILAANPSSLAFGPIKSNLPGLKVKLVKEEKDGKPAYSLELRYKPKAVANVSDTVELSVLKPEERVLTLNVSAFVQGDIKASPSILSLRKTEGAEVVEGKVTVRADKGTFVVKKMNDAAGYLSLAREEVEAGKEYALLVKVNEKGMSQDRFTTTIVVTTSSKLQPTLDIPVNFYSAKPPSAQPTGATGLKPIGKGAKAIHPVKVPVPPPKKSPKP